MTKGTEMENWDVVQILRAAYGTNQVLFNNAAQSWNHAFYWNCMKAGGGGAPSGRIGALIDEAFGSYANFRTQFSTGMREYFVNPCIFICLNYISCDLCIKLVLLHLDRAGHG